MRWKEKHPKLPKENEIRIISRFLFLPKTLEGETRWLEFVKIKQQYLSFTDWVLWVDFKSHKWFDIEWYN